MVVVVVEETYPPSRTTAYKYTASSRTNKHETRNLQQSTDNKNTRDQLFFATIKRSVQALLSASTLQRPVMD